MKNTKTKFLNLQRPKGFSQKILIAVGLIALTMFLVVGCSPVDNNLTSTIDDSGDEKITTDFDSLNSDLYDAELDETNKMLDEMSW